VFGAGKTTLVNRLKSDWTIALTELPARNPFWQDRSALELTGSLPYDLSFLLQHCALAAGRGLRTSGRIGICDWSFQTDRLWASMRLEPSAMGVYDDTLAYLSVRVGEPAGYLYLKQPAEVIVNRVLSRGRESDMGLVGQLAAASDALDRLVNSMDARTVIRVSDDFGTVELRERLAHWGDNTNV
jgi:deoxyadenosine/deoxycytidine kinase